MRGTGGKAGRKGGGEMGFRGASTCLSKKSCGWFSLESGTNLAFQKHVFLNSADGLRMVSGQVLVFVGAVVFLAGHETEKGHCLSSPSATESVFVPWIFFFRGWFFSHPSAAADGLRRIPISIFRRHLYLFRQKINNLN